MTDTSVLNPVIPINRGWPDSSHHCESYDLLEVQLTQEEDLLKREYSTGSISLLGPTKVLGHVVFLRFSPLPLFFGNVVERSSAGGQEL